MLHRQRHTERGPLSRQAAQYNVAVHQLREPFHNGKAKAAAFNPVGAAIAFPGKRLENMFLKILLYAGSCIRNRKGEGSVILQLFHLKYNLPIFRREFRGVG